MVYLNNISLKSMEIIAAIRAIIPGLSSFSPSITLIMFCVPEIKIPIPAMANNIAIINVAKVSYLPCPYG